MKRYISTFLLLFLSWQALKANKYQPQDSVGIAKRNGKFFIIHEVSSRQTLFALSKIYKVSIQDILEANEGMRPALASGQLLYVPAKATPPSGVVFSSIVNGKLAKEDAGSTSQPEKKVETTPPKKVEKKPKKKSEPKPEKKVEVPAKSEKFNWDFYYGDNDLIHTVKQGETLYKIATYYSLSVQEIMELNDLENSLIESGQELLIRKGKKRTTKKNEKPKKREEPKPKEETTPEPETPKEKENTTPATTKEVNEQGLAMVIDESFPESYKNIALHPKAKVGTLIKVTSKASNKTVYVRVVGLLQSDDKNVIVMISPEAANSIEIKGSKGQVQLSYAQ